jgi:hypothetical protein
MDDLCCVTSSLLSSSSPPVISERGVEIVENPGNGGSTLLPILIIPGFMSSGLEIQESNDKPAWQKQRLWINLTSLGFQSFHFGTSVEEKHNENQQDHEYKSAWLKHMVLLDDMATERDGIRVRAIPGLAGVDYLTPGSLTNHLSFVFGPVIKALIEAGYEEGKNLNASSYDWRVPPLELERRDHYFSNTIGMVEDMYKKNNQTPVVLLCHSLGCKAGHYFLNFCLHHKGRAWIDKYIHTYMPVGGPHYGAPKALRAVTSGDKMSLDTFLDDSEALSLGRSLGSGPWLFPSYIPPTAPSILYAKAHGQLSVQVISPIRVTSMTESRRYISKSEKFKLSVVFGNTVVSTPDFVHQDLDGKVQFSETFLFATQPDRPVPLKSGLDALQVLLMEPGVHAAKQDQKERNVFSCLLEVLLCPLKTITCFYCCSAVFCVLKQITIMSAEAVSLALGGSTMLAASDHLKPSSLMHGVSSSPSAVSTTTLDVNLYFGDDLKEPGCWDWFKSHHPETIQVRIQWRPIQLLSHSDPSNATVLAQKLAATPDHDPKLGGSYQACNAKRMFEEEGLEHILIAMQKQYDHDPIDPRGQSSLQPPPVRKVKAIYGINLPTEVGSVYSHADGTIESKVRATFQLDKSAKLASNEFGYALKGGILQETNKTPQPSEGGGIKYCSGDGTVPYYSLNLSSSWKSADCEVDITELDKAEHRAILADPRFHKTVIDYVKRSK